jgi:hypothetical protein
MPATLYRNGAPDGPDDLLLCGAPPVQGAEELLQKAMQEQSGQQGEQQEEGLVGKAKDKVTDQ